MSGRGVLRIVEGGELCFWCPGCKTAHCVNSGWAFNGNYDRPTFTPSVLVRSGHYAADSAASKQGHCYCNWSERFPDVPPPDFKCFLCHSFVTDGQIQFLADSTHELAGKTVPLNSF